MSSADRHIINKLTVEVTTPSVYEGYAIRNNVRAFIDRHVVPAVERYIGELGASVGDREFLQIDRLDISVDTDRLDLEGPELPEAICAQIANVLQAKKSALRTAAKTAGGNPLSGSLSESSAEGMHQQSAGAHGIGTLFYFLEHGSRPWWSEDPALFNALLSEPALLQLAAEEPAFRQQFLRKAQLQSVRKRLIRQFSDDFLVRALLIVQPERPPGKIPKVTAAVQALAEAIRTSVPSAQREAIWQIILNETVRRKQGRPQADNQLLRELITVFAPVFGPVPGITVPIEAIGKSDPKPGGTGTTPEALSETTVGTATDPAVAGIGGASTGSSGKKTVKTAAAQQKARAITVTEERAVQAVQLIHVLSGSKETTAYYRKLVNTAIVSASPTAENTVSSGNEAVKQAETITIRSQKTEDEIAGREHWKSSESADPLRGGQKTLGDAGNDPPVLQQNDPQKPSPEKILQDGSSDPAAQSPDTLSGKLPEKDQETPSDRHTAGAEQPTAGDPKTAAEAPSAADAKTIAKQQPQQAPDTAVRKSDEIAAEAPQKEPEHLMVDNAGLVLVHPFLRQLFLTIGLLDEQKQLTDKVLAAHVLHYLATGAESDFEHTMQFEKYLTGIPFTESIERHVPLSDSIKQEIEELLVSVKQNWKAMAGSSPEAIRETFLQRGGKLMNDAQPRLVVERKTVDILLDQLPWGMSIVKLPWMEQMIFVEW